MVQNKLQTIYPEILTFSDMAIKVNQSIKAFAEAREGCFANFIYQGNFALLLLPKQSSI